MTNKEAYRAGMKRGIWLYAHWRDGEQYVGTTGKTFQMAIAEIEKTIDA